MELGNTMDLTSLQSAVTQSNVPEVFETESFTSTIIETDDEIMDLNQQAMDRFVGAYFKNSFNSKKFSSFSE